MKKMGLERSLEGLALFAIAVVPFDKELSSQGSFSQSLPFLIPISYRQSVRSMGRKPAIISHGCQGSPSAFIHALAIYSL